MKRWALIGFAWITLAPTGASAADYVNDPLTDPTHAGRGSKGGSFSPSGWTTSAEPDAVWWEVPDALPTGHIEFTVTGISLTTLTGADHDIFTMYQAPTGQAEPIAYSPYFRNNDFKAFTRIFGVQEPNRAGAMKLELAFCPRGDPWYHDEVCTADCDKSGLAYANGVDKDVGWDGGTAYKIALDWGGGQMSFSRNGTTLGTVSYPGEYAPKPLRVRLGSPRHDGVYPGTALMPIGIVFKDVVISGTAGSMTPICGGTVEPDAGPAPDSGASGNEYSVLADVTAASWESGVYSVVNDLNVEGDSSGVPQGVVYLRFPSVTGVIQQAVLHLHTSAESSAAGGSGIVCGVTDDTWQETTTTWANRPAVGTNCVGSPFSVDPDTEYEWDVTALAQSGKNINLAVVSQNQNGAHYLSKEASTTNGPRLTVETTAGGGSGGGGGSGATAGSGGAWTDSGINGGGKGGSTAGGGTKANGGTTEDDGGCGCRSAGTPRAAWLTSALVLLAFGGMTIRRRTRS